MHLQTTNFGSLIVIRKRGRPKKEVELSHSGVKGMHWGFLDTYVRGVGWTGNGISSKKGSGGPGTIRNSSPGNNTKASTRSSSSSQSSVISRVTALNQKLSGKKKKELQKNVTEAQKAVQEAQKKVNATSGSGSSSTGYNQDLRNLFEQTRNETPAAKKKAAAEAEKAKKEAEKEAEKARKEQEKAANKAYREKLAIERKARQLFDKWKQEEVQKKRKVDNTLKKSQVTMVADRGKQRKWHGPKSGRSNRMI